MIRSGVLKYGVWRNIPSSYVVKTAHIPFGRETRLFDVLSLQRPFVFGKEVPFRDMSFCSWRGEEHFRDHFEVGTYACSECSYPLFTSRSKYEHYSPWPAFTETVHPDSLKKVPETPTALKVSCGKCGNPLGHEFLKDGPDGKSRF